jgi:hypothetical protein
LALKRPMVNEVGDRGGGGEDIEDKGEEGGSIGCIVLSILEEQEILIFLIIIYKARFVTGLGIQQVSISINK